VGPDRLLDLLLIDVVRTYLARAEHAAPGWYRAQHGGKAVVTVQGASRGSNGPGFRAVVLRGACAEGRPCQGAAAV